MSGTLDESTGMTIYDLVVQKKAENKLIQNDSSVNGGLTGDVDGVNRVFLTSFLPNLASISVYYNGILQTQGASQDYVVSTVGSQAQITMNFTPLSDSIISVDYQR